MVPTGAAGGVPRIHLPKNHARMPRRPAAGAAGSRTRAGTPAVPAPARRSGRAQTTTDTQTTGTPAPGNQPAGVPATNAQTGAPTPPNGAARMPAAGPPSPADGHRLLLDDPRDVGAAAAALGEGAVVGHAFANFYVITTRPDASTVRSVNLLKGRPQRQVGSITTTPLRIPLVYDWSRLPVQLTAHEVLGLMDRLFGLGPFGFRGPAAAGVPAHLTQVAGRVRTAQVIAPGYACPSNHFLARSLRTAGTDLLYITSANRSRHLSGAADQPAHWRAAGLRAEFGADPRFLLLEHPDEDAARERYPAYAPMSTTILAFHTVLPAHGGGRRRLVLERHGSLPAELVREVVGDFGFDLVLGPHARHRLHQREYAAPGAETRARG